MDSLYGFIKGYIYVLANTILSCYNFINNFVYKKKKGSIMADAKGMWLSM